MSYLRNLTFEEAEYSFELNKNYPLLQTKTDKITNKIFGKHHGQTYLADLFTHLTDEFSNVVDHSDENEYCNY